MEYETPSRSISCASISQSVQPAKANLSHRSRALAGAGRCSGLNGDCAAGTMNNRSSDNSSSAARAISKWPLCTGSNEPPNNPIRFIARLLCSRLLFVGDVFLEDTFGFGEQIDGLNDHPDF